MSSGSILVAVEKAAIGDELNSTILSVFLWGIYTVVYAGTLYLYLTKKSSRNKVIVWAISLSYWAYSSIVIMDWYRDQSVLLNNLGSRGALYAALFQGPLWPTLVTEVMDFIMTAVADGILIWRCYHVCGYSLRGILIPGFLLFCEVVIDVAVLSLLGASQLEPSRSQVNAISHLIAAQSFVTCATTLSSTTIIAYRIYTTSKREISGRSNRLLMHVLEILVQSAAAYSLVAVAEAISSVVPQSGSTAPSWYASAAYTSLLFIFISGIAPTVLVGRVAMLDGKRTYGSTSSATVSAPLSGLQFHVSSSQGDAETQPQLSESIGRVEKASEAQQLPKAVNLKEKMESIIV
ncbi:hypothetical protein CVT26_013257 [Gymnopilus dilepis]|uniref:Uncharacterized protein n=1 Tax=Gymnopilus dilepis TaxID=231916 RepID=A0A409VUK0_9AGAR|nr:hypothetical protein CVT26_013257 [Gymnopilus dilepis]